MSYSWVDPAFAAAYARREDARYVERLTARLRARERRITELDGIHWRHAGWVEQGLPPRPPRYL